jgi:regulator of protease activity HflC (stomatin/prohibitin superfamily)
MQMARPKKAGNPQKEESKMAESDKVFDLEKIMGIFGSRNSMIGLGIALVILFFFLTMGVVNIPPQYVGVVVDKMGHKVLTTPLGNGWQVYNRIKTDIVLYKVSARSYPGDVSASEKSKEYTLDLKTNDGQSINVDLTIVYSLKSLEVPALHQQVGPNYEDEILLPAIRSEARLTIGSFSAEEIYQGKVRDAIQTDVKNKLAETIAKYPAIQVQDVFLRHFAFNTLFEEAIEAKKLAAQEVEVNKNKALAQIEEAKRQEAEAMGGKLKAIQEAEGRAKSAKIEADAERYKLEQEAAGNLAKYKAEAEGKRLAANALGSGKYVVALEFAKNLPPTLKSVIVPAGTNSTNLMDISGFTKGLFSGVETTVKAAPEPAQ